MQKHIMVDLETLGLQNDAVILSIGAVKFNETQVFKEEFFYTKVDIDSCLKIGMSITGRTIEWWLKQSEEARKEIYGSVKTFDIIGAIEQFKNYYLADKAFQSPPIWSNGKDFDLEILDSAYKLNGYKGSPWNHLNKRCFRDFKTLFGEKKLKPEIIVQHDALQDAIWQAQYVVNICQAKGIRLK